MAVPLDRWGSNVIAHPSGLTIFGNDVGRSGLLCPQELGVYSLVAGYAGASGECWASQETMAQQLRSSVRLIQQYLKNLVDRGFLAERVRRESQHETKGKSYRLSDDWRTRAAESHAAGCVRLAQPRKRPSHTQPAPKSGAAGCESHTQPAALKRTPVKEHRLKRSPDISDSGEGGAHAPKPTPQTRPIASTEPPATRKRRPAAEPETACPDQIRLTEVSYASAAQLGFDRERTDLELERFMAKARAKSWRYTDWRQAFRSWLLNEVKWARERNLPLGPVGNTRSLESINVGRTGPSSSPRGPLSDDTLAGIERYEAMQK
jgi:Helix-turn-helix domain